MTGEKSGRGGFRIYRKPIAIVLGFAVLYEQHLIAQSTSQLALAWTRGVGAGIALAIVLAITISVAKNND